MVFTCPSKKMTFCIMSGMNWKPISRGAAVQGKHSVLVFPPLPSRLRYLIHRSTENLPDLTTFSVGESWCRRVVVCHSDLRGDVQEDSDSEGNISLSEDTARSKEEVEGCTAKPRSSIPLRSKGPRRPDQALYMPRAARQRLHSEKPGVASGDQALPSQACSNSRSVNELTNSCSSLERSTTDFKQESPPNAEDGALRILDSPIFSPPKEEPDLTLRQNEAEPSVLENTISCFSEMRLVEDTREVEDPACEHADSATEDPGIVMDDAGEEATLSQMIKAHLKEAVTVSIEHVHKDYSLYENVALNADDFRHVIEIYDFPPMFKTDDLLDAFTEYSDGGMKIKWVDNTHALGVFSSEPAALHALSICHPLLKTRALADGSKKAKGKAIRRAEFIQPVKERPRTDCAVARRMVTRALGLQGRGRAQQY